MSRGRIFSQTPQKPAYYGTTDSTPAFVYFRRIYMAFKVIVPAVPQVLSHAVYCMDNSGSFPTVATVSFLRYEVMLCRKE